MNRRRFLAALGATPLLGHFVTSCSAAPAYAVAPAPSVEMRETDKHVVDHELDELRRKHTEAMAHAFAERLDQNIIRTLAGGAETPRNPIFKGGWGRWS